MRRSRAWLAVLVSVALTSQIQAGEHPPHPRLFPWEHTQERAGCPQQVAWYARPSETPAYTGYYVGGGSACGGSCHRPDEGTWGWDYKTYFVPRRVVLYWSRSRYQGGTGAYRTDGPHVPDLPGLLNPALYFHKDGEHGE